MGWFDIIVLALRKTNKTNESKACLEVIWETDSERYRSGHNEAVLKTVCPQGRKGSNPFLSAVIMGTAVNILQVVSQHEKIDAKFLFWNMHHESTILEKYSSGWRDTPGKGAGR